MRGTLNVPATEAALAGAFDGGWAEFCAHLDNLEIDNLDGRPRQFQGRLADSAFGDLRVRRAGSRGGSLRGVRTEDRIRHRQEDVIWVCMLLDGEVRVGQDGNAADLNPGDLVILDPARPYTIEVASAADTLWIGRPRKATLAQIWDLDQALGMRISGHEGAGRVASKTFRATFTDFDLMPATDASRITESLFSILNCAIDGTRLEQPNTQYRAAVARRIKSYIEAHLKDEDLSVSRIAEAHQISTRYLAKLFELEAQSVSNLIWKRRLERCHTAIVAPHQRQSVSEIAYAHGFKNVSHFSRAFRARYGQSPRALYRSGGL